MFVIIIITVIEEQIEKTSLKYTFTSHFILFATVNIY